jgi:sugar lactone lactonase YvrE
VSRPSSCAFLPAGKMVVTSAAEDTDPVTEPLAGSLFLVDCGVEGVPVANFSVAV